ncbi:Sec20 family protein [Striga asiatica]|uniref:Sec20 family protein n=1 Tax=Striga asiatica TaxID=4170 RepID=A0A5A7QQS3_STRAF|nr:Sec20 family protein [Striga asiatica]
MDQVTQEVEKVKRDFHETYDQTVKHIDSIKEYGIKSRIGNPGESEKIDSLPRLNGLAQDGLNTLQSLHFNLDLLAPQLPFVDDAEKAHSLAQLWEKQIQSLRLSLRNANLQAKANMKKTAQQETELLLGGGEQSTTRRRNLQTKAGMTSAAESITESLRRTCKLMVQEVERSTSTLMTFEESTEVLRKAESEYKGHRSLLSRTRGLLSTMQLSKRIGILKLQRKVITAVKAGMAGQGEIMAPLVGRADMNANPELNGPLEQVMHDEL